ncbi:MAG: hypothetical protein RR517_11805, partial [Pseudomonas sp.]
MLLALQLGLKHSLLFAQGSDGIEVGGIGLLCSSLELGHGVLLALQLGLKHSLLFAQGSDGIE